MRRFHSPLRWRGAAHAPRNGRLWHGTQPMGSGKARGAVGESTRHPLPRHRPFHPLRHGRTLPTHFAPVSLPGTARLRGSMGGLISDEGLAHWALTRASFERGGEGGRGFWTQNSVYQKWPDQIRRICGQGARRGRTGRVGEDAERALTGSSGAHGSRCTVLHAGSSPAVVPDNVDLPGRAAVGTAPCAIAPNRSDGALHRSDWKCLREPSAEVIHAQHRIDFHSSKQPRHEPRHKGRGDNSGPPAPCPITDDIEGRTAMPQPEPPPPGAGRSCCAPSTLSKSD